MKQLHPHYFKIKTKISVKVIKTAVLQMRKLLAINNEKLIENTYEIYQL